jgi:hypothetical protein
MRTIAIWMLNTAFKTLEKLETGQTRFPALTITAPINEIRPVPSGSREHELVNPVSHASLHE